MHPVHGLEWVQIGFTLEDLKKDVSAKQNEIHSCIWWNKERNKEIKLRSICVSYIQYDIDIHI